MISVEEIIRENQMRPLPPLTPRDLDITETRGLACVVIGMRRSGKTYRLYQEMHSLLATGVKPDRLLYMNFDDSRVHELIEAATSPMAFLHTLVETFNRLCPTARTDGAYFFFDELQEVDDWARFARTMLDTESASLFITGSSAKLLSSEVATEFRGRSLAHELAPFSFREYLRHRDLETANDGSAAGRSLVSAAFEDYLRVGGFPGAIDLASEGRVTLLQDYARIVTLRDVLERHNLTNVIAATELTETLLSANGTLVSVSKVTERLKSRGISATRDSVTEMMTHLEDAFLLHFVSLYSANLQRTRVNPRKVYAADPGLAFALSAAPTQNIGARLEQTVYLHLRRNLPNLRQRGISYYLTQDRREVDFVVGDPAQDQALQLIQVCTSLTDPTTREREITALTTAMTQCHLAHGTIVTLYESEQINTSAGVINVVPAWRWLLEAH